MKKLFIVTKDTEGLKVAKAIDSPTDQQIAEVAAARWYLKGKRYPSEVCAGLENVVAVVRAETCPCCGKLYIQPSSAWDWYEKGTILSDVTEFIGKTRDADSTDWHAVEPDGEPYEPIADVCDDCFAYTTDEILERIKNIKKPQEERK